MLNPFHPSRIRSLSDENKRLRAQLAGIEIVLCEERAAHWQAKTEPARTLALMAAKDKEIATLKAENRALRRERDRAGRFAPCEK